MHYIINIFELKLYLAKLRKKGEEGGKSEEGNKKEVN